MNEPQTRVRWYERSPGNTSSMRVAMMIGVVTGSLVAIAGAVAVYFGHAEGAAVTVAGCSLAGAAEWAKSWQARGERE